MDVSIQPLTPDDFCHELSLAFGSQAKSVLFDRQSLDFSARSLKRCVAKTAIAAAKAVYEFDANRATITSLLSTIDQTNGAAIENLPDFRRLCAILDFAKPSVIVIYHAHLLASMRHIIPKLMRHLSTSNSSWQIVLIAKHADFPLLDPSQLPIDLTYRLAETASSSTSPNRPPRAPIPSENTRSSSARINRYGLWRVAAPTLIVLAVMAIAYFLRPQFFNTPFLSTEELTETSLAATAADSELGPQAANPDEQTLTPTMPLPQQGDSLTQRHNGALSNTEIDAVISQLNQQTISENSVLQTIESATAADINNRLSPQIVSALETHNFKQVRSLLQAAANLEATNEQLQTPLIIAAQGDDLRLVTWLINQGSNLDHIDNRGHSALHYSAINGNQAIAQALIDHQANINLRNNLGITPLMTAVQHHKLEVIELLLAAKANINIQDDSGWSALFYAVWNDNQATVRLLREHGANRWVIDNNLNSLEKIARIRNNQAVLAALDFDSPRRRSPIADTTKTD